MVCERGGHRRADTGGGVRCYVSSTGQARAQHGGVASGAGMREMMERMRVDTQVMRYQTNDRNGYGETAVTVPALHTTVTEKLDSTRPAHNCHGGLCFGVIFFLFRLSISDNVTDSVQATPCPIRGGGVAQ